MWRLLLSVSLFLTVSCGSERRRHEAPPASGRQGKFFSIFNIVSFPNGVCNSTANKTGICYTDSECSSLGGTPAGRCAQGFGSCCVFTSRCGTGSGVFTLDKKVSYLENQNYPRADTAASMCLINVEPISDTVCQVRLDFEDFSIDGGSAPRRPCDRDSMLVTDSTGNSPGVSELCGVNTGQHLYLPITGGMAGASIRIATAGRDTGNFTAGYKWSIKATQIDCRLAEDRSLQAPDGCLQYHTEPKGVVKSFNFSPGSNIQYPTNLNYAICIHRPTTACQITYKRDPDTPAFSTSVGKAKSDQYKVDNCGSENGCGSTTCIVPPDNTADSDRKQSGDYLLIPGGLRLRYNAAAALSKFSYDDYYCGVGLGFDGTPGDGKDDDSGVISKLNGPIVIRFVSDDKPGYRDGQTSSNSADVQYDELGFSVLYEFQTTCTTIQL